MKDKKELVDAVMKKTFKDGDKVKLKCSYALKIAAEFGVAPMEVGNICNENNIRLTDCQLGCFK